jgi:hypothetical protein
MCCNVSTRAHDRPPTAAEWVRQREAAPSIAGLLSAGGVDGAPRRADPAPVTFRDGSSAVSGVLNLASGARSLRHVPGATRNERTALIGEPIAIWIWARAGSRAAVAGLQTGEESVVGCYASLMLAHRLPHCVYPAYAALPSSAWFGSDRWAASVGA